MEVKSKYFIWSWDSSVSIATSYGMEIFLFSTTSRLALGITQPLIQWVLEALSPGVKRLGHAHRSPPSSSEVKNGGAIPPLPIHLHGVVLN
jgi:hypothetical protein